MSLIEYIYNKAKSPVVLLFRALSIFSYSVLLSLATQSFVCCAAGTDFDPNVAVGDFKKIIKSPPVIEEFEIQSRTIRSRIPSRIRMPNQSDVTNAFQIYVGSRSGSNFFVQQVNGTEKNVIGRVELKTYNVVSNAIYLGSGVGGTTNQTSVDRITQSCEGTFKFVCQLCQIGLADIRSESIVWKGNEFIASDLTGRTQYGLLEVSDGVPQKLEMRWKDGEPPFKTIEFFYQGGHLALAGFPNKIIISVLFDDGLHPFMEIVYAKLKISQEELPNVFFEPTKFLTRDVVYTNIWSASNLTSISPKGSVVASIDSIQASDKPFKTRSRFSVFVFLMVSTLALILTVVIKTVKRNTNNQ